MLQSLGSQKVKHDWATAQHHHTGRTRIWIHLLSSKPMNLITKFALHGYFVNSKGFFICSCASHKYTWRQKKKHNFNFSIISILWLSWQSWDSNIHVQTLLTNNSCCTRYPDVPKDKLIIRIKSMCQFHKTTYCADESTLWYFHYNML